jgi:hypothetical protein
LQQRTTVILEGITTLQMWPIEDPATTWAEELDPALQEEGRMFNVDFELHWQRLRGYPAHLPAFRTRFITDNSELLEKISTAPWQSSDGTPVSVRELRHASDGEFYLLGEAVRDSTGRPMADGGHARWYEKEVPRMFNYPIASNDRAGRVKVVSRSYILPVVQASGVATDGSDIEYSDEPALLQRFVGLVSAKE